MIPSPFYEDFALKIEPAPKAGQLQVRLLASPIGGCSATTFRLPYADRDPADLLRPLESVIVASGYTETSSARAMTLLEVAPTHQSAPTPREIGQALFEALFVGTLRESLLSSLALIESRSQTGLRIRLVIDPRVVGPVSRWPWELMYRHETREYFSRNVVTPIVRQLEVRRPSLTPRAIDRLRLLVVLSNPAGLPPLNVQHERELIEAALGSESNISLRFLEKPTLAKLNRLLHDEPFDALHFIGHGDLDEKGHGRVLFEDSTGRSHPIPGTVLADTLKGFHKVPVVFLNACETARLPRDAEGHDPYSGTASALVMAGIPAVIAMQFPITDRAALRFSGAFYSYLATGAPLELAVAQGRRALHDSWEWATPVLFLGVPQGQFFTRADADRLISQPKPPSSVAKEAPQQGLQAAISLFEHQRYDRALDALLQVSRAAPTDPVAAYYACLARLQGRRPRAARLDVIKKLESDLGVAFDLAEPELPAHFWYLQALIKYDFYRYKGMRIRPPSIEEVLTEARSAPTDLTELQRLLDHVPTPPSLVREAIAAQLKASLAR